MKPGLRRIAVRETGGGLEPLAVFVGRGGRMLGPSAWDRIRWRAWERMRGAAGPVPSLPRVCWVWHDLRHTFALRLLIFLTRQALGDIEDEKVAMATLIKHMAGNPLLVVQRRLGHAHPSTTYRYLRYLGDPMREVDAVFRRWSAAGGASYVTVARRLLGLEVAGAAQG